MLDGDATGCMRHALDAGGTWDVVLEELPVKRCWSAFAVHNHDVGASRSKEVSTGERLRCIYHTIWEDLWTLLAELELHPLRP